MIRGAMGKLKKNLEKPKEQNQPSISNFFKAGGSKSKENKLFSTTGAVSTASKLSLKKPSNNKIRFTENVCDSETVSCSSNSDNCQERQVVSSAETVTGKVSALTNIIRDEEVSLSNGKVDHKCEISDKILVKDEKPCSNQGTDKNEQVSKQWEETRVIPETQIFKSPVNHRKVENTDIESCDLGDIIIPDTPESESKLEFGKQKKIYGRSFLTAGHAVAKAPGLTKIELMERKRMLRIKKKVSPVLIEFNQPLEKPDSLKQSEQQQKDGKCVNLNKNQQFGETSCQDLNDNWGESFNSDLHGVSGDRVEFKGDNSKICEDPQEYNVEPDAETPTKNYGNNTVKRMSKSGLSPSNKRIMVKGTKKSSESNIHEDFRTIVESREVKEDLENEISEVEGVKRNLMEFENVENKPKMKPSALELNHYQLTMRRTKDRGKVIDTKNDDCLTEILQNLHQPSLPLKTNVSKRDANVLKLKTRKSLAKSKTFQTGACSDDLIDLNSSLTREELEYFDSLDEQIHLNVGVFSSNDLNQQTEKDKRTGMSEAIHVSRTDKPRQYVSLKPRSSTLDSHDKEASRLFGGTKIEEVKTQPTHNKNEKGTLTQATKITPSQIIKEFTTQQVSMETHENNVVDMEITDYHSQGDNNALCDTFKQLSPFKKDRNSESNEGSMQPACVNFGRHTVTNVEYIQDNHELAVAVSDYNTGEKKHCILSGFWADTKLSEGDVVHILGEFDESGTCRICDKEGLIIVNPDLLLSGTTVVSSVFCKRKSVLNEKFKGYDKGNIHMLYGSIIHYIFQQVIRKRLFEESQILKEAENTIKLGKFLHEIYGNNVTETEVMEEIKKYIPPLQKWIQKYTNIGQDMFGGQRKTENLIITKIKDIEENIWSPRFGVKGKIDMTVEIKARKMYVSTRPRRGKVTRGGEVRCGYSSQVHKTAGKKEVCTVPLELKTGRPTFSMEHEGQITLYSMMSSDRREDPHQGLLLYLKEPDMKVIPADSLHKSGLIQLRNEMAHYLSQQVKRSNDGSEMTYSLGRLPEPINNPRACMKCPHLLNCTVYQQEIEERTFSPNHTMTKLVPETLGHLLPTHLSFFKHWCLLLNLEQMANHKSGGLRDLWCKTGEERERTGMCMSGFILQLDSSYKYSQDADQVNIKFIRQDGSSRSNTILSDCLALHDFVIVSAENSNHIAVCTGSITSVSANHIELITERESLPRLRDLKNAVYRFDKYDSYNTFGIFFTNLSLLLRDDHKSAKLRELIIDRRKPEFVCTMSKGEIEKVKKIFKPLNKPQKSAILKVLMSKDYVLIKGYPGTGKTSTVVALVKVLVTLGYSVLLTSYTHSAVDNILLKLKKDKVDFLRLGRVHKVHPSLHQYCAEKVTTSISSVADLREYYNSQKVVATSCLGMSHPVFTQRKFDFCIMDEASQALQLASIGPLFMADRFILVGDPKQLPPVIRSKEARELGMDESLFARLDGAGATYELNLQYRMNKDIMYLSNNLVYEGALKCGNDHVACQKLDVSCSDRLEEVFIRYEWLRPVFCADCYQGAVFLDTCQVPAPEVREKSGLIKNTVEAQIVLCIAEACIQAGIAEEDIGVIAPYTNQVILIRSMLSKFKLIEVNTVDQYQGRDKDVIIISFTRSFTSELNPEYKSGELLKDIRRLNVAITRAKKKLILVGNINTLKSYPPLATIIQMMKNRDTIKTLPSQAHMAKGPN